MCPFCPVLCPFCPSHKRLKFAGTIYDTKFIGNFEGLSGHKGQEGHILALCFFPGRAWLKRDQVMIKFNQ